MAERENWQQQLPTEEGRLVIKISRALFDHDVDQTFRILGEYLDKHRLQISAEILEEYQLAARFKRK